ncbi:MAG: malonyl-CoA O-methyltransferase [Rickettsiales bacterium]|jgi:malonyl-CoA O-methyltransferase
MIFDKSQIKNNFSRASESYDQNAILQKIVAKNLVKLAQRDILESDKILDLGSGTGFVAGEILGVSSDKKIFQLDLSEKMLICNQHQTAKIVADIENLPFAQNSFDLAISSLSFQWLNDLEKAIPQILEILKNGNNLHFSILGNESLKEVRVTKEDCGIDFSINDFIDEESLKLILNQFDHTLKKEEIILDYQDCSSILKSMKKIGASYSSGRNSNRNNLSKSKLELLNKFYLKNFKSGNKVRATWQVFYVSIKSFK